MTTQSDAASGYLVHAIPRRKAAKALHICLNTFDAAVKRGEIRVVRYCSRVYVPSWELDRLLGVKDAPITRGPSLTHQQTIDHDQQPRIYGQD